MRLAAEKALAGKLSKLFSQAEKDTLKLFLKHAGDPDILQFQTRKILQPLFELETVYTDTILYDNIKAFVKGRESTINLLNAQLSKAKQLTLTDFDPSVYNRLSIQTFKASAQTMARVEDNVMKIIAQSYQENWGIKDATRHLKKEFNGLKTYEANRIARTEINSSLNQGSFQTYHDYGIQYHQWWTGQDSRVRNSHKHLHGQIVPVGVPFENTLMYPGDRTGPIKEWIHCRCTTVPYLMPLGFMAPIGQSYFFEGQIVRIPDFNIPKDVLEF